MSKKGLQIDYNYYEDNPDYFEDLKVAAGKLTVASQEQFEEIKNEKWFNRVFDLVTLSNQNDKRIASQIGNLAQAQEIVMEILVRLSDRDRNILDLVLKSFKKIEKLSQQDITLAKKIKQLENNFVFGISMETSLEEFSQLEKQILAGILHSIMKTLDSTTDNQRKYANTILNFIGVEAQQIDLSKSINSLKNIDTKREILTCGMEYIFLSDFTFEYSDEIGIIFDEFDFGNKTIEQITEKIKNVYDLQGVNGFIDKYNTDEYFELEEEFFVDLEEMEYYLEEVEQITDTMISSILTIKQGESKIIKNSIVRINSYINCMGELIFENCTIYYNELDFTNEITLAKGASLRVKNSKIICKTINQDAFIKGEGNNEVILENCEFHNCSYFIKLHGENDTGLTIESCNIINPSIHFFEAYVKKGLMINTTIKYYEDADSEDIFEGHSYTNTIFGGV